MEQRSSDYETSRRDIPSFIEPRPPLIQNPFMRPRPQKCTNLLEQFEESSEIEGPELVKVYLRVKPCNVSTNLFEVTSDKCLVTSVDTTTAGHGRRTQHNISKIYTFSRIFKPECTQKEIFEQVVKENLKKLPEGQSFTLLTYGASGSGKTYTLMGTVSSPGLVPRSLEYVFKLVDAAQMPTFKPSDSGADQLSYAQQDFELQWVKRLCKVSAPLRDKYRRMSVCLNNDYTSSTIDLTATTHSTKHYVWVSFVEIYNEAIYDLLAPPDRRVKMHIREDSSGNVYVKGATQAFVRSGGEAYDVMAAAKQNLVVAATGIHAHSSRSHCIFTITMLTEKDGEIRTSHVRLCDLAGSERQRAARNTGARMQESRAINTSLHVLERCIHMVRRNQRNHKDNMVPYRESKLTRLLGAGLSGSRGEAVAIVVTLNPAPQYAHEIKYILSFAAVAQDIQINNTMYTTMSTLESTAQDETINTNAEILRLRAENERLHFELLQAETRNNELQATIENSKMKSANTMRELVEETKDMMRQYYEAQIQSLKAEMEYMKEEYEGLLAQPTSPVSHSGSPVRYLREKNSQLMTEIAVLEENVSKENLARAVVEKEVQYLRHCIEERDQKAFQEAETDDREEIDLIDSDFHESDEDSSDPYDESLEPIIKIKSQNRSHISHKEQLSKLEVSAFSETINETIEETTENEIEDENNRDVTIRNNSVIDKDSDDGESETVEENQFVDASESLTNLTEPIENINDKDIRNRINESDSFLNDTSADKDKSECEVLFHESIKLQDDTPVEINENLRTDKLRGTYFVSNDESRQECIKNVPKINLNAVKETDIAEKPALDSQNKAIESFISSNEQFAKTVTEPKKGSETVVSKIIKSLKDSQNIDNSLTQFEQLELAANDVDISKDKSSNLINTDILKEKRPYFNDSAKEPPNKLVVVNKPSDIQELIIDAEKSSDNNMSHALVGLKKQNDKYVGVKSTENRTNVCSAVKVQEKQSFCDSHEKVSDLTTKHQKSKYFENKPEEKDTNDIILSSAAKLQEKRLFFDSSESVPEHLSSTNKTQHSQSFEPISEEDKSNNLAKIEEKQLYFDNNDKTSTMEVLISSSTTKKRCYFDNIDENVDAANTRKLNDVVVHSRVDQRRAPLVLGETDKEYEPSIAVKKILGESFTKHELLSSIQKNKSCPKKHESVDIFESPQINFAKSANVVNADITSDTTEKTKHSHAEIDSDTKVEKVCNIEFVRKSIEKLVLLEKPKAEVKREIKLEPALSIEERVTKSAPDPKKSHVKETIKPEILMNEPITLKENNTIDEFENICKDLSNTRATEFELLVTQEINTSELKDKPSEPEPIPANNITNGHEKQMSEQTKKFEETKYNLRNKEKCTNVHFFNDKKEKEVEEILAGSHTQWENKARTTTKRSLRLRRRKKDEEDTSDQDNESKFKDITNLKKEFSDITMGLPVTKEEVKYIPSPEKLPGEEENLPVTMGIQSCPSKSVTRSRRKLFTPRAEPLEESLTGTTGDSNERLRVPRPSYHRVRARRKL